MKCHESIEKSRSKIISYAVKLQHCQEADRHTAVSDVYPDSQRFHLSRIGKRDAVKNIRFDFSSVDSEGLQNQDYEIASVVRHVDKKDLDVEADEWSKR